MSSEEKVETPEEKGVREEAMNLTSDKIVKANNTFPIVNPDEGVRLVKVEMAATPTKPNAFLEFAEKNLRQESVSFIPFDKFRDRARVDDNTDDVGMCREGTFNDCEIDESCTRAWSNATMFAAGEREFNNKLIILGEDYEAIKKALGLNYDLEKEAYVVVFEIFDGQFVRVPCSKYPSVKCKDGCLYDSKDIPLNLCSDKETLRKKYPQVSNTIDNMGLCKTGGMPFKGNGETPSNMKEFAVYMGQETKGRVEWVGPLSKYIDMLQQGQTQQQGIKNPKILTRRDALKNLSNISGGANKRRKYKKTKKKRSKKKRSKKRRSRKYLKSRF